MPARLRLQHELDRGETRRAAGDGSCTARCGGSRRAALKQYPVGFVAGAAQVLLEQVHAAACDAAVVAHRHERVRESAGGLSVLWTLQSEQGVQPT